MIFNEDNFQNDITWKRTSAHSDAKRFGNISDKILYYTKSSKFSWNQQYTEYDEDYLKRFRFKDDDRRTWTDGDRCG